ncbi:MAG: hypothetical protein K2O03_01650, partial [Lachnospiraceae bacterium]|nr:hypothetical protein [Lachnospiraceae bacterium]
MEIVTNDMMIHDWFGDKYAAIQGIKDSIQVLLELRKNTRFVRLSAARNVFRELEIAPGYYFEQLFSEDNNLLSQKEKATLKSLFVNFSKIELQKDNFQFEGMKSEQCAWAFLNHAFVFSLPMDEKWKSDKLLGILHRGEKSERVEIGNISLLCHIKTHGKLLGVRKYELNPKHKINVGWGTEMDLTDKEAQELLMLA